MGSKKRTGNSVETVRFELVPAFLGRVFSATRCGVWLYPPRDVSYKETALVEIDLAASPEECQSWSDVVIDDYDRGARAGGFTRARTPLPQTYGVAGLYLRDSFLAGLDKTVYPGYQHVRPYEYEAVAVRDDDSEIRHYKGYHAQTIHCCEGILVVIDHAGSSLGSLAPCKVWKPKLDDLDHLPFHTTEGPLFLGKAEARALSMLGPKLPAGSGHVLIKSADPCDAVRAMDAISVVDIDAGGAMNDIAAVLNHPLRFGGDLLTILRSIADCADGTMRSLDLIGHSRHDGVLTMGDWAIDGASPVWSTARPLLEALGVTSVRLLGCNTACTPIARAARDAIADRLGIAVYGTAANLFGVNYGERGFESTNLLSKSFDVPGQCAPLTFAQDHQYLSLETLSHPRDVRVRAGHYVVIDQPSNLAAIADCVSPNTGTGRGMQSVSDAEVLVAKTEAVASIDDFGSFEVLNNWRCVRVHSKDSGDEILFDVSNPEKLKAAVAKARVP